MRYRFYIIGLVLSLSLASLVSAETLTLTASIRFLAPITFSNPVNPDLGAVDAGISGRNFILQTDGSISGVNANEYQGGAQVGSVKLFGSNSQQIDIVAQNISNNGGVSISSITCNYAGAGDVNCIDGISAAAAPTNTGKVLLFGLDVITTTSHLDGDSAAPEFDIIATYN